MTSHVMTSYVMTLGFSLCPKFGEYQLEFKKSSVWNDHQNITKYVLNEISNAINFTVGKLLQFFREREREGKREGGRGGRERASYNLLHPFLQVRMIWTIL